MARVVHKLNLPKLAARQAGNARPEEQMVGAPAGIRAAPIGNGQDRPAGPRRRRAAGKMDDAGPAAEVDDRIGREGQGVRVPTVSLKPPELSLPPLIVTLTVSATRLAAPSKSVPALTFNAPVKVLEPDNVKVTAPLQELLPLMFRKAPSALAGPTWEPHAVLDQQSLPFPPFEPPSPGANDNGCVLILDRVS